MGKTRRDETRRSPEGRSQTETTSSVLPKGEPLPIPFLYLLPPPSLPTPPPFLTLRVWPAFEEETEEAASRVMPADDGECVSFVPYTPRSSFVLSGHILYALSSKPPDDPLIFHHLYVLPCPVVTWLIALRHGVRL